MAIDVPTPAASQANGPTLKFQFTGFRRWLVTVLPFPVVPD